LEGRVDTDGIRELERWKWRKMRKDELRNMREEYLVLFENLKVQW
jgi:hypothetical protein